MVAAFKEARFSVIGLFSTLSIHFPDLPNCERPPSFLFFLPIDKKNFISVCTTRVTAVPMPVLRASSYGTT